METLTPDEAGNDKPSKFVHKAVACKPDGKKDQNDRPYDGFGKTGNKGKNPQCEDAAAFAEHLQESLLKARHMHFFDGEIGVKGDLQGECKTHRRSRYTQKP